MAYCHTATAVETGHPSLPNANAAAARERERSAADYVLHLEHHHFDPYQGMPTYICLTLTNCFCHLLGSFLLEHILFI